MSYCKYSDSGCNAPQGQCMSDGKCMTHSMFSTKARCPYDSSSLMLHRVDTSQLPDCRAAIVAGNTDELPIDYWGDEPIRWIQAAAGYVALLLAVVSVVAFAIGYFSK